MNLENLVPGSWPDSLKSKWGLQVEGFWNHRQEQLKDDLAYV